MNNKICYIADLDQDIDDIIAVEYLVKMIDVSSVVCSPYPQETEGKKRLEHILSKGIFIAEDIPEDTNIVFCGGALTPVARYIEGGNRISALIMNGGFVGNNIVKNPLPKFKNKQFVRTYNFNCDVESADKVMRSTLNEIKQIILVGKNVCHSPENTISGIWKDNQIKNILDMYDIPDKKKLHDVLACHEGLSLLNIINDKLYCVYENVRPATECGLEGNMTKWGSVAIDDKNTPYRKLMAAVGWNSERKR